MGWEYGISEHWYEVFSQLKKLMSSAGQFGPWYSNSSFCPIFQFFWIFVFLLITRQDAPRAFRGFPKCGEKNTLSQYIQLYMIRPIVFISQNDRDLFFAFLLISWSKKINYILAYYDNNQIYFLLSIYAS